jgi:hypothetical protein
MDFFHLNDEEKARMAHICANAGYQPALNYRDQCAWQRAKIELMNVQDDSVKALLEYLLDRARPW